MMPVYESMRKYKWLLTAHPSSSKRAMLLLLYLLEEAIFLVTEVLQENIQCSVFRE